MEGDQKLELEEFNRQWDEEFEVLNKQYSENENVLRENQEKERQIKLEEFEESYPKVPKPCHEVLNLNKVLESAVKQKEYFTFFINIVMFLLINYKLRLQNYQK
jgi:hypothetical protein